jgi:hypothetical protein
MTSKVASEKAAWSDGNIVNTKRNMIAGRRGVWRAKISGLAMQYTTFHASYGTRLLNTSYKDRRQMEGQTHTAQCGRATGERTICHLAL